MRLLLAGSYWFDKEDALRRALSFPFDAFTWQISDGLDNFSRLVGQSDAMLISPDVVIDRSALPLLAASTRLRLLQLPFAGYDWLTPGMLAAGCVACNVHEHSSAIAEYVMAGLLEMEIGLRNIDRTFRQGSWEYGGGLAMGRKHGELSGKRLGIFGYGHIGRDVAMRASAFGLKCVAVGRALQEPPPALLEWLGGPEAFGRLLGESDYLVVCASLNETTRGKFDAAALGRMRKDAILVNVARGALVDEGALFTALQTHQLRGAVLDVWYAYPDPRTPSPRPASFPFEKLPNVLMTPHCASWTYEQEARRLAAVCRNLSRFAADEPLDNVVPRQPGTDGSTAG